MLYSAVLCCALLGWALLDYTRLYWAILDYTRLYWTRLDCTSPDYDVVPYHLA